MSLVPVDDLVILESDEVRQGHEDDADDHQQEVARHEIGVDHEHESTHEGHRGFLLFSVDEVPCPGGTEQEFQEE